MLSELLQKVKAWMEDNKTDLFTAFLIFLVGLGSFGLGRLSILWPTREPITITDSLVRNENHTAPSAPNKFREGESATITSSPSLHATSTKFPGQYVGSKSGNFYHYPWCPGALRIKDENKIWFQTKAEAESRGYQPSGNCPGL